MQDMAWNNIFTYARYDFETTLINRMQALSSLSEILDLYYHLHDDDSQKTMMELAKSGVSDLAVDRFEDSEGVKNKQQSASA